MKFMLPAKCPRCQTPLVAGQVVVKSTLYGFAKCRNCKWARITDSKPISTAETVFAGRTTQ